MPTVKMRRITFQPTGSCNHAGLLLERGFSEWNSNGDQKANSVSALHQEICAIGTTGIYRKAYERWYTTLLETPLSTEVWFGKTVDRLFIGLGEANPIESAVTLHHTYGVPFIPGSAIKGVTHHFATENGMETQFMDVIFGREPNPEDIYDCGEAGYVTFNDAWWKPDSLSTPLIRDVITVHHQQYYSGNGHASDFDDPNPNLQLAVQGSFMFSIQGCDRWRQFAMSILSQALTKSGIGAKTSAAGYGHFVSDTNAQKRYDSDLSAREDRFLAPEEKLERDVSRLTLSDLPLLLGRNRGPTSRKIGKENWSEYLRLVRETFGAEIEQWKTAAQTNQKKAYKTIHEQWDPWNKQEK